MSLRVGNYRDFIDKLPETRNGRVAQHTLKSYFKTNSDWFTQAVKEFALLELSNHFIWGSVSWIRQSRQNSLIQQWTLSNESAVIRIYQYLYEEKLFSLIPEDQLSSVSKSNIEQFIEVNKNKTRIFYTQSRKQSLNYLFQSVKKIPEKIRLECLELTISVLQDLSYVDCKLYWAASIVQLLALFPHKYRTQDLAKGLRIFFIKPLSEDQREHHIDSIVNQLSNCIFTQIPQNDDRWNLLSKIFSCTIKDDTNFYMSLASICSQPGFFCGDYESITNDTIEAFLIYREIEEVEYWDKIDPWLEFFRGWPTETITIQRASRIKTLLNNNYISVDRLQKDLSLLPPYEKADYIDRLIIQFYNEPIKANSHLDEICMSNDNFRRTMYNYLIRAVNGNNQNIIDLIQNDRRHLGLEDTIPLLQALQNRRQYQNQNATHQEQPLTYIKIEVNQSEDPILLLQKFSDAIDKTQAEGIIRIHFLDQAGIDDGGLTRQFINDIFRSIVQTKFFIQEEGFYTPFTQDEKGFLTKEEVSVFNNIGNIIMHSFYTKDNPTGIFFKDEIFTSLISFKNYELNIPLSEVHPDRIMLHIQTNQDLRCLWQFCKQKNRSSEAQALFNKFSMSITSQSTIIDFQKCMDEILEIIIPKIAPLHAIAQGMRNSPFSKKHIGKFWTLAAMQEYSKNISGTIQGILDPKSIKFSFSGGITKEKSGWIKEWIRTSSPEKVKNFLRIVTGSSTRSLSSSPIKIVNVDVGCFTFHTCASQIEIPFNLFLDKETFLLAFESTLEGCSNFNNI